MFCYLEQISLTVEICPIHRCIYRGAKGICNYKELTEDVTVERIANLKDLKPYKVQEEAQKGKRTLSVALIIDNYTEFITTSFPNKPVNITVINDEQPVASTLRKLFNLNSDQQLKFWSKIRFDDWCRRQKVTMEISLSDIYEVLKEVST